MASFEPSGFRVEKARTNAVLTLTTGTSVAGAFFVARSGPVSSDPERVADLLNSEPGFFPFEVADTDPPRAVLYNRRHIVTVMVPADEARRDPGYAVATARNVSMRLTDGRQIIGSVRVYRPQGRDRLSDWARHGERFRYIEAIGATFIVNVEEIVDVREITEVSGTAALKGLPLQSDAPQGGER
jgi:hypothetical protein